RIARRGRGGGRSGGLHDDVDPGRVSAVPGCKPALKNAISGTRRTILMAKRSFPASAVSAATIAAIAAILMGCAGSKKTKPTAGGEPVKVDEGPGDLAELAKAVKTH